MSDSPAPRAARAEDIASLAKLWHDGWHDAHAAILPADVTCARTRASFLERLSRYLPNLRAIGEVADPLGFALLKGDELNQFYVQGRARGTGIARLLMEDCEQQFAHAGVHTAWLACAIGNDRAARFYEKAGWHRAGIETIELDLPTGGYPLDTWRYEKRLR
jgi:GNAT superfamily N-acetyltransferase